MSPLASILLSATVPSWPWGWIVGVACGVALMVAFDLDWRRVPERARTIVMATRRKSGWAALAAGSVGVLLFY